MTKRSMLMMVLLFIFTLGIYPIYWYIVFQCELKKTTGEGSGAGMHILLTLITFGIYPIYWQFVAGKRLAKLGTSDLSVLYIVFCFIGLSFLNPFLMQNQANSL